MLGMMLAGSVAACAYEGSGDPLPTAAGVEESSDMRFVQKVMRVADLL